MNRLTPGTRRFLRHYVEMILVMFAGMAILWLPAEGLLRLLGSSTSRLQDDAPAAALLGMAAMMTAPMVAWMRRPGHRHSWQLCNEMAAAMFGPALLAIVLQASGAVTDYGWLMVLEHNLMFVAMLGAMLARRAEYSGAHHVHA